VNANAKAEKQELDEVESGVPDSHSVFVPAIAMIGLSGIWAIVGGFQTWSIFFSSLPPSGNIRDVPAYWGLATESFALTFATQAIQLCVQLFIVYGASCLLYHRRFWLAFAAAALSSIPLCSAFFVLGMPFGIWAMVMLMQNDVRARFRETRGL
jgi:hypothetical protein